MSHYFTSQNGFLFDATGKIKGYKNPVTQADEVGFHALADLDFVPLPEVLPAAFTYDLDGNVIQLYTGNGSYDVAVTSLSAKDLFNKYSTAYSAPGSTFYVNVGGASGSWGAGSDSNNGLSRALPFSTLSKCITASNAAALPAKVTVFNASYVRANAFTSTSPTVDIAWVAEGGRVTCGSYDAYSAPSADGTYTHTYSMARSLVDRVVDLKNTDRFGHWVELTMVSSAAICDVTPNSWYTDGTTLYMHRADGAAVTNANTRYYLSVASYTQTGNVNTLFTSEDGGFSGFDFEGGLNGCISAIYATPNANKRIFVAENCTFRYSGGKVSTAARGAAIDGFYGHAWFYNCDSSRHITDGFNSHNTHSATTTGIITVNCTGHNNGAGPQVGQGSCNGWTSHEDSQSADFAGFYQNNHGGSLRSIGTSVSLLCGTLVKDDLGDAEFGGTTRPAAFETDDTAAYYCYRTRVDCAAGRMAYFATNTSNIYQKRVFPTRGCQAFNGGVIQGW